MKCQNCGENDANVKYTQIINGVKKQMSLCEECASKLGIMDINVKRPARMTSIFDDMFNDSFFEMPSFTMPRMLEPSRFQNFVDEIFNTDSNLLGMSDEYLEEMEREEKVKNKVESRKQNRKEQRKEKTQLEILQDRLEQEIKEERYEDAAKTRDEIKKLK